MKVTFYIWIALYLVIVKRSLFGTSLILIQMESPYQSNLQGLKLGLRVYKWLSYMVGKKKNQDMNSGF